MPYSSAMGLITVCILFGGRSGEYEVSCRSAASVARNLDHERYRQVLIGIDREGRWHLQQDARFQTAPYGERLEVVRAAEPASVVPGRG